jgi:hypothetical protein
MRISPGPGAVTSTASAASTSGARRQAVEMVIHSGKTEAQVAAGTGLQRIQPHSLNICTSFNAQVTPLKMHRGFALDLRTR